MEYVLSLKHKEKHLWLSTCNRSKASKSSGVWGKMQQLLEMISMKPVRSPIMENQGKGMNI